MHPDILDSRTNDRSSTSATAHVVHEDTVLYTRSIICVISVKLQVTDNSASARRGVRVLDEVVSYIEVAQLDHCSLACTNNAGVISNKDCCITVICAVSCVCTGK